MPTTAVIIISIALALTIILSFLLLSRIHIRVLYDKDADGIDVCARYIFIKKQIYPKKEKIRISDFEYKKYQKRLEKKRKKAAKKAKKAADYAAAVEKDGTDIKNKTKNTVKNIKLLLYIIKKVYRRFLNALRIDVNHINITVATDNAAKTAITYGAVYQGVECLLSFIDENIKIRQKYSESICLDTDYLSDKPRIDINIVFSVSVAAMLDITFRLAYNYIKCKLSRKGNNE